jgi:hypothetical protein
MQTILVTQAKADFLQGRHQPQHTYKLALFRAEAELDALTGTYDSETRFEVEGRGYVTGGRVLRGIAYHANQDSGQATLTWTEPVRWESATITAARGLIYNDSLPDRPVVVVVEFGEQRSVNGTFQVRCPQDFILLA